MKLEGTPQELAEFLHLLTRQEESEDIGEVRYLVNPNKVLEDAIRSTIVGVGVERSGR